MSFILGLIAEIGCFVRKLHSKGMEASRRQRVRPNMKDLCGLCLDLSQRADRGQLD